MKNHNTLLDNIYREPGKGIIITKDFDVLEGEFFDLCPHDWTFLESREEFDIYRCERNGCLRFDTEYRSSLDDFIRFLRKFRKKLPKLEKVPEEGYVGLEKIREKSEMRNVKKYLKVLKGLNIANGEVDLIKINTNGARFAVYWDPSRGKEWVLDIGVRILLRLEKSGERDQDEERNP